MVLGYFSASPRNGFWQLFPGCCWQPYFKNLETTATMRTYTQTSPLAASKRFAHGQHNVNWLPYQYCFNDCNYRSRDYHLYTVWPELLSQSCQLYKTRIPSGIWSRLHGWIVTTWVAAARGGTKNSAIKLPTMYVLHGIFPLIKYSTPGEASTWWSQQLGYFGIHV